MRLWHYDLIEYLPSKQLVSQWRECIAIKRQWEKGSLRHGLVKYVLNYEKACLFNYLLVVERALIKRKIKYNKKFIDEFNVWCEGKFCNKKYDEHNLRYLRQCLFNLQEKYDRGIISNNDWKKIAEKFCNALNI